MSQPLLSILIPAVYGREKSLSELISSLQSQIQGLYNSSLIKSLDDIEITYEIDDKKITVGEKRESLYRVAKGVYSLQIDDDDGIASFGLKRIIQAVQQKPDCITYKENCMMNGKYYSSNHSLKYDDWADNFDGFDFVRTPFYKDVIKTEIARSVPFEYIRWGEDHSWARALKPHLRSEVHIPEEIYFYIHNSKPEEHNERYGIQ